MTETFYRQPFKTNRVVLQLHPTLPKACAFQDGGPAFILADGAATRIDVRDPIMAVGLGSGFAVLNGERALCRVGEDGQLTEQIKLGRTPLHGVTPTADALWCVSKSEVLRISSDFHHERVCKLDKEWAKAYAIQPLVMGSALLMAMGKRGSERALLIRSDGSSVVFENAVRHDGDGRYLCSSSDPPAYYDAAGNIVDSPDFAPRIILTVAGAVSAMSLSPPPDQPPMLILEALEPDAGNRTRWLRHKCLASAPVLGFDSHGPHLAWATPEGVHIVTHESVDWCDGGKRVQICGGADARTQVKLELAKALVDRAGGSKVATFKAIGAGAWQEAHVPDDAVDDLRAQAEGHGLSLKTLPS